MPTTPMPIPPRNLSYRQQGGYGEMLGKSTSRKRNTRDLPGATQLDPTGKRKTVSPVENAGAGNTGFERFLSLHRGNRGGRTMSSKTKGAYRYTGGKAKGMTQGEMDIQAHRQYQKMSDRQRDQFRAKNEGDYAKQRERNIQQMRDEAMVAKENPPTLPTTDPTDPAPKAKGPWVPPGGKPTTPPIVKKGATGDTGAPGARGKPGSNIPEAKRKRGLRTGDLQ